MQQLPSLQSIQSMNSMSPMHSVTSIPPYTKSIMAMNQPSILPSTAALPSSAILPTLPMLPLTQIAKFPLVMSIGNLKKVQYEKIDMLINNNVAIGALKECNIIIITRNDEKICKSWNKKYPLCLICDKNNDMELLYHLNSTTKLNKDAISKFVVFDNCLNNEYIHRKYFRDLLDTAKKNNVAIAIITNDTDVICSDIWSKLDHTLLHTLTLEWSVCDNINDAFLKQHPGIISRKDLDKRFAQCDKDNGLAFCHNTPFSLAQF
jgi:hypothetical protein